MLGEVCYVKFLKNIFLMEKSLHLELNEEQKEFIKSFVEDYKASNWFTLLWTNFVEKCGYHKVKQILDRRLRNVVDKIDWEYTVKKENFLDYWEFDEEGKKELEKIINCYEKKFWGGIIRHKYDGNEEEAMKDFLSCFETELNTFFNIKEEA